MKIIFLNAWRGLVPEIKQFILDQVSSTDIFCFQEYDNPKKEIFCLDYLKDDYQYFFDHQKIGKESTYNVTFVKNNLKVLENKTVGKEDRKIGLGIFTKIKTSKNNILNIVNFHGLAFPGHKQDTPNRLRQSQSIVNFLKDYSDPKIIGGDFNLDRDIKSTQIFEENGYLSLIKEFNITNTRNRLSWEQYPDSKQYFADHLFITSDLKITSFTVPYNEISDHLPLIIEVNY